MKAVRIHEFGGPEVLKYEDLPEPELRRDEVMIRVKACALNHLDLWVRRGLPGITLPRVLGSDVSGDIAAVGDYVSHLQVGQRVLVAPMTFCGHCHMCGFGQQNFCPRFSVLGTQTDGGYRELMSVRGDLVIPIPSEITYDEAAAVPLVFLTAWHMLVVRARIKPGDVVLVLGAGSGVGSAAIQIVKLWGGTVITTAGSDAKLEHAKEIGADYVIDHYRQKISEEVRKITAKRGVDIVIEHVGEATWAESAKSLRPGGTLVTCGATTGPNASLDLRFLFSRQLSLLGSYMGNMGDLHEVLKHIFKGKLKAVVDKSLPLHEAAAAHIRLENREQFGKIVLNP
jgi:NADPH:quinone reductase-like Zn-dependent oxidoreductase